MGIGMSHRSVLGPVCVLIAITTLLSCSEDPVGPADPPDPIVDTAAPFIVATTPDSGAIEIPRTTVIEALFSEPIDPLSVTDSSLYLEEGFGGTLSYSSNKLSLALDSLLGLNSLYHPRVRAGIRDTAGNEMVHEYGWVFRTDFNFNVQDLVGEFEGVYTAGHTDLGPNAEAHQPILWSFTDSEYSMRLNPAEVIDTTFPTCGVDGTFTLDLRDLILALTQYAPDTTGGLSSCDPRWNPDGEFRLFRITPFADTIEFRQNPAFDSSYRNIRIERIRD